MIDSNSLLSRFLSGPDANLISILFGAAGFGYAIYASRKNPTRKSLAFRLKGSNIVNQKSRSIPNLDIRFEGCDIGVLSETQIHFWNAGNSAITSDDIPPGAPLAVWVPKECRVLGVTLLKVDGPAVMVSPTKELGLNSAAISVTSIERGKGALISVLHTAPNPYDVRLIGAIKDNGAPILRKSLLTTRRLFNFLDAFYIATLVILGGLLLWANVKVHGIIGSILPTLVVGFLLGVLLTLFHAGFQWVMLRLRRRLLSPSAWVFEKTELSETELRAVGEAKT